MAMYRDNSGVLVSLKKTQKKGAGETAKRLRALASLPKV